MNIQEIKLSELKTSENNPRTITTEKFEKLVGSILCFPSMLSLRPIVVDNDNTVLGGNMRTKALSFISGLGYGQIVDRLNGMESFMAIHEAKGQQVFDYWKKWLEDPTATIVRADDLTEEEKKQFVITDNASFGTWDYDLLANEWNENLLMEWGLDLPWLDEQQAEGNDAEPQAEEDNYDAEQAVEPTCQAGDLWKLGEHRLICGDSTSPADVEALMDGEQADLWLTDPPYNVAISNSKGDTIENDNMSSLAFREFLTKAFSAANAVMKDGCPFYIWFASREHINFELALNDNGLQVHEELIWNKNALVLGRHDYQYKHEPCLYGWKNGAAHYFRDIRTETTVIPDADELDFETMKKEDMKALLYQIYDDCFPKSVIDENKPSKDDLHPTMKPVRLFGRLITNSSRQGEIVLDTFGGSGTTIVACEQLGRKARLVELDPHYCDVIINRWEQLTGNKAELLGNVKRKK